jgi:hypothetical protein
LWSAEVCRAALELRPAEAFIQTIDYIAEADYDNLDYEDGRSLEFGAGFVVNYVHLDGEERRFTVSLDDGGPYWFTACA